MSRPTILISGASIAGPTLAFWLNQYGYDVTIVERAPALRPGGYAVDVRGAAVEVLKKMNLYSQAQALDTNIQTVKFAGTNDKQLLSISADIFGGRAADDLEIMRGDLSLLLYNATKTTTTYIWDDTITDLQETQNGIEVKFKKSATGVFDAVIGADGLHSTVRKLTFGDEAQFIKHLGAYISIATIDNYKALNNEEVLYGTVGKTAAMYSSQGNTEAKAMFLFNSPPLNYDHHSTAQQKAALTKIFNNEPDWEIPELLKRATKASDFYMDSISQIVLPTYYQGRVVLVGDAAYCASPASGQGTSLALVGAYVLAGEIAAANGNMTQAFKNYETIMRPFAEKNQKIAPIALKGMIAPSKSHIRIRNLMFHVPSLFIFMNKQILNMIQKAATAIKLTYLKIG